MRSPFIYLSIGSFRIGSCLPPGVALLGLLLGGMVIVAQTSQKSSTASDPTSIQFREFFDSQSSSLKPSSKLESLNKKRVKLVGFMAKMELPLEGSFYLVPQPVFCDEEGGGTADLPPEAVLVTVRSLSKERIPFVSGPIEVIGILSLGNEENDGRVSAIRVTLDEEKRP